MSTFQPSAGLHPWELMLANGPVVVEHVLDVATLAFASASLAVIPLAVISTISSVATRRYCASPLRSLAGTVKPQVFLVIVWGRPARLLRFTSLCCIVGLVVAIVARYLMGR